MFVPRRWSSPVVRRLVIGLTTVSLVSAVACGSAVTSSEQARDPSGPEPASWLFAIIGPSARVDAGTGPTGTEVILNEPGDVVAFTDRPERRAVRFTPANLVAEWDTLFGSSPPNAVLTGATPTGQQFEVAVEISGLQPTDGGALGFTMTTIGEDAGTAIPDQLSEVTIFIDDVSCDGNSESSLCLVYASTFVPFDSSF